ncbi:MAG: colicin V synthesis protein [Sulfurimonas sp. RIFOXYD12_FULL_33_39]|uniref:CvpA family protein n=1 Tax=unclassified Sulfurimonas TaxID=2623549 RepID=UPI0008CF793A|nr:MULTISPECIES: CvpA family protein [unclassified Sulfurimonas]OHE05162.1 MAG: colicin V synthesis protein [Sulfurimonas sp. RIFCSPLOWO2_12_FULL_34_6]OHE09233.1 MAG: colicin V synthesis protein [Sulfurimonas sp. RIFOXYD12_FULL_33_39]OHE12984.1 MAG: colicin V synthesis protein [Sulfurimonas sp. RIFOXYD2_FULL_34_21]
MSFSYFDVIVSIIILLLGLKGIINGFFKELFGLLGIIGGIFIASRVAEKVGQMLSDLIFKFENSAAVSFTGFLVTLTIFWLFMVGVGVIFKKLSSLSGLSIFDKLLGFFFSASKFFLIAAVIAYATYNVKAMKTTIDSVMKNSFIFPILVETGSVIMKLDHINISDDINQTIDKSSELIQEKMGETIQNSALKILEETKTKLNENLEQNLSDGEHR